MDSSGPGKITDVCITTSRQRRHAGTTAQTGINKAPTTRIAVRRGGVEKDSVLDTKHHGGLDKAVYAYAKEDAAWWALELGTPIPAGRFGENLRTEGVDLTGAVIGETWSVGSTVRVEVSEPRVPCSTFTHHMQNRDRWVKRFSDEGRTGTYLRVLVEGEIEPGDEVAILSRPDHGVTIGDWFAHADPAAARALLAAESDTWHMASDLGRAARVAATR